MANIQSPAFPDELYNNVDYGKQFFDVPADVLAPHPDLFESELDSSLAALDPFQFELLEVNHTEAFTRLRSDTPTCGPPSTITVSSESASAYDSFSNYSESLYSYPKSPFDTQTNYSLPLDLEMDFQRQLDVATSDYGLLEGVDNNSYPTMPPTPPRSPPSHGASNGKVYNVRSSFSDYGPSPRGMGDYYTHVTYGPTLTPAATVSPTHVSAPPPSIPLPQANEESKGDPRKKYRCNVCPRAFARAYNLKTHMATHDPNREKPFVCPHRSCSRSFSRKHDLGRHLISIHRDESVCSSQHSASSKKSIGVEKGARTWCEGCGKSWIGRVRQCNCNDVK